MTAKDVYAGKLKVGDRVRVLDSGEVHEVTDLFTASVDGSHLTVVMGRDFWRDISQVERVED